MHALNFHVLLRKKLPQNSFIIITYATIQCESHDKLKVFMLYPNYSAFHPPQII